MKVYKIELKSCIADAQYKALNVGYGYDFVERSGLTHLYFIIFPVQYARIISSLTRIGTKLASQSASDSARYLFRNMDDLSEIAQDLSAIYGDKYDLEGLELGARTFSNVMLLTDAIVEGKPNEIRRALIHISLDCGEIGIKYFFEELHDKYKACSIAGKTSFKVYQMFYQGKSVKAIAIEIAPDLLRFAKYASPLGSKLDSIITVFYIVRDLRNIVEIARENGDFSEDSYQLFRNSLDAFEQFDKMFGGSTKSKGNKEL